MSQPVDPRFSRPGFSGQRVPFYGITFDKKGHLLSPKTQETVVRHLASGEFTDVIIFSHGWNNDWDDALEYYIGLLDGVGAMAGKHAGMLPDRIKPMMVGIGWPSAALVWPSERTPGMATTVPGDELAEIEADIDMLSADLSVTDAASLRTLLSGKEALTEDEVDAFASLISPNFNESAWDETDDPATDTDTLATMFKSPELIADAPISPEDETEEEDEGKNFLPGVSGGSQTSEVQTAGALHELFGLRMVVRLATVRLMKDRAGVVGGNGVAGLLSALLLGTPARVHMVGHSYGCKVMGTAASKVLDSRQITSFLMLQPAINHYAFASDVGDGRVGGFHSVLAKVKKPILSTMSRNDFPLRQIFHLTNNRSKDFAEGPQFAGLLDKHRGMGGYGPAGLDADDLKSIEIPGADESYPSAEGAEIINLEATGVIKGHSKINIDEVFWAMVQNLAADD